MFKIDENGAVWIHYGYIVDGKIEKAETLKLSKHDEKCFSCIHFFSNELGDMLCEKSKEVIQYRDVVKCRKNNFFEEKIYDCELNIGEIINDKT